MNFVRWGTLLGCPSVPQPPNEGPKLDTSVQRKTANPFQPQKSVSSTQKRLNSTQPSVLTKPLVKHQNHFSLTHPSVQHTPQFNTLLSSTPLQFITSFNSRHISVQHTTEGCVELRSVLNWRVFDFELTVFLY